MYVFEVFFGLLACFKNGNSLACFDLVYPFANFLLFYLVIYSNSKCVGQIEYTYIRAIVACVLVQHCENRKTCIEKQAFCIVHT